MGGLSPKPQAGFREHERNVPNKPRGEPPDRERAIPAEKPSIIFRDTPTRNTRPPGRGLSDSMQDHRYPPARGPSGPRPPTVVLDTNVVMDWLVFRNPTCATWTQWFDTSGMRWLVSDAMREELAHVLERGATHTWEPSLVDVWRAWDRYAVTVLAGPASGATTRIRCTDGDDQKFLDLALDHGAHWLVSRDKALLRLNRRVRPLGLDVLTPQDWAGARIA